MIRAEELKMQKLLLPLSALVLLSGCSVQSETWINQAGRLEVREDQFTDTFETAKLNKGTLRAVANHYDRYGNGPVDVVVSYDAQSKVNTLSKANKAVSVVKSNLSKYGVSDIRGTVSDARGTGDFSTTLITFPAITASSPKGCGTMPGYNDPSEDIPNNTNIKPPYGYGCTVETLLAKQISKPSDMMGKNGFETLGDGRRTERVLSTRGYYGDKENPKLDGENASEGK